MITAIDTNVLLDILLPNPDFYKLSAAAIEESAAAGVLVICDVVYAELAVHFPSQAENDEFLAAIEITVESLNRESLFLASRAWIGYRKQGGPRTRILSDFLIGAHAQTQATKLLSRDRGFYRLLYPNLETIDPSQA